MDRERVLIFKVFLILCMSIGLVFTTGAQAKDNKREILIGANMPLTGGAAGLGVELKWTYQTAVDDVNKAGGVFVKQYNKKLPVRLEIADDETDAGKASAAVERLIKIKKVDLLVGGIGASMSVIPGAIAAEKHKKLYHTSMCIYEPWAKHNLKYSTLMFYEMLRTSAGVFEVMKSLPEEKRPKKPAIITEDTLDGKASRESFIGGAEKHGYKIALIDSCAVGGKDYSPQIIKAKSMGVDALMMHGSTSDQITFLRQMKENDYNVPFVLGYRGFLSGELPKMIGKDSNYLLSAAHWTSSYPFPGAKELGERFYKEFNKPSVLIGPLYALCQVLFTAIERAGTLDSLLVRQAILANEFENTVMGKIKYNDRGYAEYLCGLFQWWDGQQKTVWPFQFTDYKVKLAPPWKER